MGVSFRVARVGTRYKPKLVPIEDKSAENASENDSQQRSVEGNLSWIGAKNVHDSNKKDKIVLHSMPEELEVSFSLNLFKDGFSIGKANEFLSDVPKYLHPYDQTSETLFSAIECGWLPGEMLGDIPCKYVNGALMCEIRDYRTIFPCKEGHTSPTGNAPTVHKMILHLCMETVVKDILSLSNDSWTYKDLLEIESCIIKALQPDLHLNPEPLWQNFFGEPPRKKLDLGIAWSWKKRKLSDVPAHSLPIKNSNLVNVVHSDCLIQRPRPQSGPLEKNRSTFSMQENISNHFCNPQGINSALDYTLPSCAMMVHKTSNFVSVPSQLLSTVNTIAPRNPIVPSEEGICGKQAIEGLPYKKPKQEPVDLPKLQLLGSKVNIAPQGPELRWVDNELQEQIMVDKIHCENKKRKLNFPQSTHDDQMVLRGIQNQLTGAPSVKQEPAETIGLHTDYICMNSQVTAPDISLSTTSQNVNSLQSLASINTGQKNLGSKGLKTDMADSVVSMVSTHVTNANYPTVKSLSLLRPSVELNIAIDRLLKILRVSERYGMNNRKCKLDQAVAKKPFSCQTPHLVGFHLAKLADSGNSGDSTGYKISPSKYSTTWKTRTLIFSHEFHIIQGCDSPMVDREAQIKLVMLENLGLETVEAQVYYGCEQENPISIPLLPTFLSTLHSANRFASQFTSLMVREGYCIISDQVGSPLYQRDGESGVEKQPNVSNAIITSGMVKPSAMCIAGPSPTMQNSSTIRMPLHDLAQSPRQNILSGVNFTASGNNILSLQPTHSSSSKSQVDNLQQQMRSLQQWWQQGTNKFSWLQYKMELLRHRQEQELLRTELMVDLSASASGQNTVLVNDGIQRIRNFDSSSRGNMNILENNGSAPILSGGPVHWLNSLGFCYNLENNHTLGLNDKQLFCALSDHRLAAFPKLNTSLDVGGRGLMCGLPTQRNASMLAIAKPDGLDMGSILTNHRMSQQLRMMQQQEIRSMLQPQKAASLADPVGSLLPLVPSLHDQGPLLSAHQLNPIAMSTLPHMNPGSISGSGSPDVSSWTHGSVGSSKT